MSGLRLYCPRVGRRDFTFKEKSLAEGPMLGLGWKRAVREWGCLGVLGREALV